MNDIKEIIKYLTCAIMSFGIDILFFSMFKLIIKDLLIVTILARIISSLFNYYVNKYFVFKFTGKNKKSLIEYYSLVIVQMFVSGITVDRLYEILKINATIIKIVVDTCIFIINYLFQKFFIFHKPKY